MSALHPPASGAAWRGALAAARLRASPLALARILVPLALNLYFFDPAALDPRNVAWLVHGDWGQHFVAWTAFRYDDWHWPLGQAQLLAYPYGVPISVTDSNPLVAILLKPLSPVLPESFQYVGPWLLLCVGLSYSLLLNLFIFLTGQRWPSAAAAALVTAAPFFFSRYGHDTLMAQWLAIGALSVFIRGEADRAALARYAGLNALAVVIHPYFLMMISVIAGADVLRRAWARRGGGGRPGPWGFAALGLVAITAPAVLIGSALGLVGLSRGHPRVGEFSMDPLAWANSMGLSAVLPGWTVGPGQYEGFQYLGLGGLAAAAAAGVLLALRRAALAEPLRRSLPWLAPAAGVLVALAISPTVTAFGRTVFTLDVSDWPLAGIVLSTFRSSGRLAWPASYLLLVAAAAIVMSGRTPFTRSPARAAALLAALALLQLADLAPLARSARAATASKDSPFTLLSHTDDWRALIGQAARIYVAPGVAFAAPGHDFQYYLELGWLAFPQRKPLSRFYTAHDAMPGPQRRFLYTLDAAVARGELEPDTLYVLDDAAQAAWSAAGVAEPARAIRLDGLLVVPAGE